MNRIGFRVQGRQQTLAREVIGGQTIGTFGQVLLNVLIALREFLHQIRGAVEMGDHFILIGIETLLNVVQLALGSIGSGIGQQTRNHETDGNTGDQCKCRQQPN